MNFLLLMSAISSFSSFHYQDFESVLQHSTVEDIAFANENNISSWDEYYSYVANELHNGQENTNDEDNDYSISDSIEDPQLHLRRQYPNYIWQRSEAFSRQTSDISNSTPVEMKGAMFPRADIQQAISVAGVGNKTNYGGCGPIAVMGILDYYARYLGYTEIIDDPTDSNKRIALAAEVMSNTYYSVLGSQGNSTVWPWDAVGAFDAIVSDRGLPIDANYKVSLGRNRGDEFWNDIKLNIDQGLPVSMFTSDSSGSGSYADHYTNVYGYETWVGMPKDGLGGRLVKKFVKARLNFGNSNESYCDADILDYSYSGIVTYTPQYTSEYGFDDDTFAEEFVNESGCGQYFFSPINKVVSLSNGINLNTNRLRASYIENQYLVLSPNRENAGEAYIEIGFPHSVPSLSFDVSLWSTKENINAETFTIQYYEDEWIDHISIDPTGMLTKDTPSNHRILFPKNTQKIRFVASHPNPIGSRNKGRICLDHFTIQYN